ncbi:MAG TPA: outer membrane lipoprotein carrier protein LolA [Sutterella sp.]|nr:outer membrane lipoprotein carrier protein LolA [Sutterella sp.]
MKCRFTFALTIFVLATTACAADAVRMLESFTAKVESASGRFMQYTAENRQVVASGRFSFSRPGKFLWETQDPFKQTILSDGKTLWVYDPDLNQVTIRELNNHVAGLGPAALLFGKVSPQAIFHLKDLGKSENLIWVRATPKESEAAFSVMDVGMDAKGFIRELRLTDSFGEVVRYKLQDLQTPSALRVRDYVFQIPPKADVLKDTSLQ